MTYNEYRQTDNYRTLSQQGHSDEDIKRAWEAKNLTPEYAEFVNSDKYANVSREFSDDQIQRAWEAKYGMPSYKPEISDPVADGEQAYRQTPQYATGIRAGRTDEYLQRERAIEQEQRAVSGTSVSGGILDIISKGEGVTEQKAQAKGYDTPYDITLGYGAFADDKTKPITQMTIAEVRDLQDVIYNNTRGMFNDGTGTKKGSSAVGKYQIIRPTLNSLVEELGLSEDTIFSQEVQDQMGIALLNRRGYQEYLNGDIDATELQKRMSREWASISDPATGKSHYGQHTGVSVEEFNEMLGRGTVTETEAPTDMWSQFVRSDEYRELREGGMSEEQVRSAFERSLETTEAPEPVTGVPSVADRLKSGAKGIMRDVFGTVASVTDLPIVNKVVDNIAQRWGDKAYKSIDEYNADRTEFLQTASLEEIFTDLYGEPTSEEEAEYRNARIEEIKNNSELESSLRNIPSEDGDREVDFTQMASEIAEGVYPTEDRMVEYRQRANLLASEEPNWVQRQWQNMSLMDDMQRDIGLLTQQGMMQEAYQMANVHNEILNKVARPEDTDNLLKQTASGVIGMAPFMVKRIAAGLPTAGVGSFQMSAAQGTGDVVAQLVDEGVSIDEARKVATTAGLAYGAVELLQIGQWKKAIQGLQGKAVNKTTKRGVIEFIKDRMKDAGVQITEEAIQRAVTETGSESIRSEQSGEEFDITRPIKGAVEEAVQAGPTMVAVSFLTGGLGRLNFANTRSRRVAVRNTAENLDIREEKVEDVLDKLEGVEDIRQENVMNIFSQEELDIINGVAEVSKEDELVEIVSPQEDAVKQVDLMTAHKAEMEAQLGREVTEMEVAEDWVAKPSAEQESLAEEYRDTHIIAKKPIETDVTAETTQTTQEAKQEQEGIAEDVTEASEEVEVTEDVETQEADEQVADKELREKTKETKKKERSPLASPLKKEINKERKREVSESSVSDNIIEEQDINITEREGGVSIDPVQTTESTLEAQEGVEATNESQEVLNEQEGTSIELSAPSARAVERTFNRIPGISIKGKVKDNNLTVMVGKANDKGKVEIQAVDLDIKSAINNDGSVDKKELVNLAQNAVVNARPIEQQDRVKKAQEKRAQLEAGKEAKKAELEARETAFRGTELAENLDEEIIAREKEEVAGIIDELVDTEDRKELSATSTKREAIENMSLDEFREKIKGGNTRYGKAAETASDDIISGLKDVAANYGIGAINRMNTEKARDILNTDKRQRGRSEEKQSKLEEIATTGSTRFNPTDTDHNTWVKSKVVDYDVTPNVGLAEVSAEDLTADEQTAITAIALGEDVVASEDNEGIPFRDIRSLVEKGLVTVDLVPGTTKARGGKETRFNNVLRGTDVGSGVVANETSLDVITAEGATPMNLAEDSGFDAMEVDDISEAESFFGTDEDVDTSWGLFNRSEKGANNFAVRKSQRTGKTFRNMPRATFNNLWSTFLGVTGQNGREMSQMVQGTWKDVNDATVGVSSDLFDIMHFFLSTPSLELSTDEIMQYARLDRQISKYMTKSNDVKGNVRQVVNDMINSTDEDTQVKGYMIEAILNTTGIDQFNFTVDSAEEFGGYFDGIDNIIGIDGTLDGALSFAHEVGHWAYKNLLTPDQRASYVQEFVSLYGENGRINTEKVLEGVPSQDLAGYNFTDDVNEVFAEHFSQYVLNNEEVINATKPKTKSIFDYLTNIFKSIWNAIRGRKNVDPLFDKYIELALSNNRTAMENNLLETVRDSDIINERPIQSPFRSFKKTEDEETGFRTKEQADKKKRAMERAVAQAIIEQDISELGETATSVDEVRHRFISFAINTIPEGPIRKNFLKTVMSIKSADLRDPSYKHAIKVTNRYAEARRRDNMMSELKKKLAPSRYKKLEGEQIKQIEAILEEYDLAKMTNKTFEGLGERSKALFNTDPRIASSAELLEHEENLKRLAKTPLRDTDEVTMANILEEVNEIYATSKAASKARKEGRANSIQAGVDDITNSIENRADELTKEEYVAQRGVVRGLLREALKGAKKGLGVFANVESIANIIDGENGGALHRQVIQPIVDGYSEQNEYAHRAEDFLVNAIKEENLDVTNWSESQHSGIANKGYINEVERGTFTSNGRSFDMTKAEQVSFVRSVGDSDALRHIIRDGMAIGENRDVVTFTPGSISEVLNNIDDDVYRMAEIVGDYYVMEGTYLDSFLSRTVGTGIDVSSSHHPMLVKGDAGKIDSPDFNSVSEITGRIYQRSFQKGSTKARIKGATGALLLEDVFVTQARTAREAGTFVGLSKSIPYVSNVLDKAQDTMEKKGLKQEHRMLKNVIDQVGAPDPSNIKSPTVSRAYSGMRKLFVSGALGFKVVTSALQTVSAGNYVTMADQQNRMAVIARTPALVTRNFNEYIRNLKDDSALNEEMFNLVPAIRERFESANIDRDFGETGNQANARRVLNRVVDKTTKRKNLDRLTVDAPMTPITFMDKVAIKTIFDLVKMEADMNNIAEADRDAWVKEKVERTIRQTQPTFSEFDKSEILRTPVLKEFTMFSSQRSKYVNMTYRAIAKINEGKTQEGIGDLVWIGVAVPAMITALKMAWRGLKGGEEDRDIEAFFKSMINSTVGNFPIIGDVINNILAGKNFPLGGALSAQAESLTLFANSLKSGDTERISKNAKRLATNLGLPAGLFEIKDVVENTAEELTNE